ncbi:hypothetical protein DAEQUDRAFT_736860 [Daedalea quercina L-15889]|uniref:Uncharacterized protein n=1 Tax=Daedalea quercina L-15889 TaxID=1314783 RepID=A0A165S045_9APHY|nr:hypothetical protein DAEQUDRAFT_736860 [Daedalea quercina L-15889]
MTSGPWEPQATSYGDLSNQTDMVGQHDNYNAQNIAVTIEPTAIPVRAPQPCKPVGSFDHITEGSWDVCTRQTAKAAAFKTRHFGTILSPVWIDHARVGLGLGADRIIHGHIWTMGEWDMEHFANRPILPLDSPLNIFVDIVPNPTQPPSPSPDAVHLACMEDICSELPIPPPSNESVLLPMILAPELAFDWRAPIDTYRSLQAAIEEAEDMVPGHILSEALDQPQMQELTSGKLGSMLGNVAPYQAPYKDWLGVPSSPIEPGSPVSDDSDPALPSMGVSDLTELVGMLPRYVGNSTSVWCDDNVIVTIPQGSTADWMGMQDWL